MNGIHLKEMLANGRSGLCRIVCELGAQDGGVTKITTTDSREFDIKGEVPSEYSLLEITAMVDGNGSIEAQMCTPLPMGEDCDVEGYNKLLDLARNPAVS